jgi:hypothetical protein
MSRPTHRFYREKNYLEVDLDIHLWRYLTRKFLLNAPQRFHLLVRSTAAQLARRLANFPIRCCTQQRRLMLRMLRELSSGRFSMSSRWP